MTISSVTAHTILTVFAAVIFQTSPSAPIEPLREVNRSPEVMIFIGEPEPAGNGRVRAWAWALMGEIQADGSTNGYATLNEIDCAAGVSRVVVMEKYFHTMPISNVAVDQTLLAYPPGTAGAAIHAAACNYARMQTPLLSGPEEARSAADAYFGAR